MRASFSVSASRSFWAPRGSTLPAARAAARGTTDMRIRERGLERDLTPKTPFVQREKCTLRVQASQVADVDEIDPPDTMESDYVISFTVENLKPRVTAVNPATGAVDVALDASLTLHFSEPVTMSGEWVSLHCSASGVRGIEGFSVSVDEAKYTLTPTSPLGFGERCTLQVHAAHVADTDGTDSMASDFFVTFQTRALELLYEGFDDGMPADWALFDVDGKTPAANVSYVNQAWIVRRDVHSQTNQAVYSTSWYTPSGQADDWLVTPALALPPDISCTLSWRAVVLDPDFGDGYEVRISTTDATPAGGLANPPLFTIDAENEIWTERSIPLDDYAGDTVYLAFRNHSNDKYLLLVDDIHVRCVL